jgi:hypothetical protein
MILFELTNIVSLKAHSAHKTNLLLTLESANLTFIILWERLEWDTFHNFITNSFISNNSSYIVVEFHVLWARSVEGWVGY